MLQVTSREQEVLELIAKGHTSQHIAQQLFISHETVKSHRKNLLERLNALNTANLIAKAYGNGLLTIAHSNSFSPKH